MGCNASKLDGNNGVTNIPATARPLFLLRLEEYKRRRHQGLKGSTPSKKNLLLEDGEDNENASTNHPSKAAAAEKDSSFLHDEMGSCVTSEGSKGGSPETPISEKLKNDNKKGTNSEEEMPREKGKRKEDDDDQERKIEPLAKEESNVEHIMDENIKNEEKEDHDDKDDDDDGRNIKKHEDDEVFPGSPSFRVYFEDNTKDNKNEELDDHLTDMASANDDPVPSKLSAAEEVKKGKKRRSFKMVLPTGIQAKNLFNVRACMSSNSTRDRNRLLTAKAHA